MAYFPFFIELEKKEGLVVGGGQVAFRKIERLLPYGPRLTVVAPKMDESVMQVEKIVKIMRAYKESDLQGKDFVIAATDNRYVNQEVADVCKRRRIPVNSVDDIENCSFLFPALVHRGALSVGICTGGTSPPAAIYVKKMIESILPDQIEEILDFLQEMRTMLKTQFPKERDRLIRMKTAQSLFEACLEKNGTLSEAEWTSVIMSNIHER